MRRWAEHHLKEFPIQPTKSCWVRKEKGKKFVRAEGRRGDTRMGLRTILEEEKSM
jgi:hypothetical protein